MFIFLWRDQISIFTGSREFMLFFNLHYIPESHRDRSHVTYWVVFDFYLHFQYICQIGWGDERIYVFNVYRREHKSNRWESELIFFDQWFIESELQFISESIWTTSTRNQKKWFISSAVCSRPAEISLKK